MKADICTCGHHYNDHCPDLFGGRWTQRISCVIAGCPCKEYIRAS